MDITSVASVAQGADEREVQLKKEAALREQVLRRLIKVRRVCIPDLENELSPAASAKELKPVIDRLLEDGVIRRTTNTNDPRQYTGDRTVYELAE